MSAFFSAVRNSDGSESNRSRRLFYPVYRFNEGRLEVEAGFGSLTSILTQAGDDDLLSLVDNIDALAEENKQGAAQQDQGNADQPLYVCREPSALLHD